MTSLIRLYPKAWRLRYGEEMVDLMEARNLGAAGTIDVIRGALDAHRHPELVDPALDSEDAWSTGVSRQRLADLVVARRLGMAAIAGALAWIAGWLIAANGPLVVDGETTYRSGEAGAPFVLLAMVLLSAGLVGQVIRLPARARVARLAVVVAVIAGPLWGISPWTIVLAAVLVVAWNVMAVAAWWAGQWSGVTTLATVLSIGAATVAAFGLLAGAVDASPLKGEPMLFVVMACTPVWLAVGASLQRLPPLDPRLDVVVARFGAGEPA